MAQLVDYELQKIMLHRLNVDDKHRPTFKIEVDKLQYMPGAEIGGFFDDLANVTESNSNRNMVTATLVQVGANNTSTSGCILPATILGGFASNKDIPQSRGFNPNLPHYGIDFAVQVGTPIMAPWDGVVHTVAFQQGYGQVLIIHHGGTKDVYTVYGHLNTVSVAKGQKVSRGSVVATTGGDPSNQPASGVSTGPHLHFEIRTAGKWYKGNPNTPVNPQPFLDGIDCAFPSTSMENSHSQVLTKESIQGYSTTTLKEMFATNPFIRGTQITKDGGWAYSATPMKQGVTGKGKLSVDTTTKNSIHTLSINKTVANNAILSFEWMSAPFTNGDMLNVYADGTLVYGKDVVGTNNQPAIVSVGIKAGTKKIEIKFTKGNGTNRTPVAIGSLMIQEVTAGIKTQVDLTHGQYDTIMEAMERMYRKPAAPHKFGRFMKAETMTLDSVMDIQLQEQYEQSTQELTITIANPNGFYSPDYNPAMFPELNLPPSPWSYRMDGVKVGVLSENTPIRAYFGYGGRNLQMFTGKIGRVMMNATNATMTIVAYGMFKTLMNRTILYDLVYPDIASGLQNYAWLKSSIVEDLVRRVGLNDYVIQESVYLGASPYTEKFYTINKDGTLTEVGGNEYNLQTPYGFLAPYTAPLGTTFKRGWTYEDAVRSVLEGTDYRVFCDRFGTFRMEREVLTQVVTHSFTQNENMMQVSKTIDYSKARSHLQISSIDGNSYDAYDDEILINLKGEIRSAGLKIDYPIPQDRIDLFRAVTGKYFLDMKRIARSLTVAVVGDPSIDLLDRVMVTNRETTTRHEYIVKGIRHVITKDGYVSYLDLTWDAQEGSEEVS